LLLITCPSPPGLGLELQSIIMILLDVFLCLSGAVQELVLFLVYFSAGRMGAASASEAHLVDCLFCQQLWCCQLQLPNFVTKLLVSCVLVYFTQLDLIHPWPCCELLCTLVLCTLVIKRTDTSLGH
jgi:hypothetical protein